MKKIWEFFDTMDELVYVSDMDNYDLIYMNQTALRIYGFHSLKEIVGKKCYKVTQHCSVPAQCVTIKSYDRNISGNGVITIPYLDGR